MFTFATISKREKQHLRDIKYDPSTENNKKILKEKKIVADMEEKQVSAHVNEKLDIDYKQLNKLFTENFYDEHVMRAMFHVLGGVVQGAEQKSAKLLKQLLVGARQIGEESVEGYAISSSLGDGRPGNKAENMVVIKAPRSDNVDLAHEIVIGKELNKLRKIIPNFSYVLGGMRCGQPLIKENKEVQVCYLGKEVQYVIYENVRPFADVTKFVETATLTQFLNMYMQVLFSLRIANRKLGYTHYDLHTGNVLMHRLNQLSVIKYDDIYLQTDALAMFIDYGFSRVEIKGESFGSFGVEKGFVSPYHANPMHDAFKLLMYSLYRCIEKKGLHKGSSKGNPLGKEKDYNRSLFTELQPLFNFFVSSANMEKEVLDQRDLFFSLPLLTTEEKKKYNLDNLISHIYNCYPEECESFLSVTLPSGINSSLSCSMENSNCLTTTKDALEKILLK